MNCKEIEIYLYDYAEGNMLTENMHLIKEHLDECMHCRQKVDYLQAIQQVIEEEKTAIPSIDLSDRILQEIGAIPNNSVFAVKRRQLIFQLAAAVVIGIGILSGILIGNQIYSSSNTSQLSINEHFGFDGYNSLTMENLFVEESEGE